MANIPQVKFSIVADGIGQVKAALKSVQDASLTTSHNVIRHWNDVLNAQISVSNRQVRLAQDTARQISQAYKQITPGSSNIRASANGGGSPNLGGMSGAGSGSFGSIAKGLGFGSMAGIAMSVGQKSFDLTGIPNPIQIIEDPTNLIPVPVRKAFEVAKDMIVAGIHEIATGFASAATELGGAKNVAEVLTDRAHAEKQAAINWAMSTPEGRAGATPSANFDKIRSLSAGTIFSPEVVAQAQAEWVKATGSLDGFNSQFSMLNEMAVVSGQSLDAVSKAMTILRNQFQDLDEKQFKKLELAAFGLSKLGEVPFEQITKLSKATGVEAVMTGGPEAEITNFSLLSAIAQKTAASMGGGSRVATAEARFFTRIAEKGGFGFKAGLINDPRAVIEAAAVAIKNNPSAAKGLGAPETALLLTLGKHATGSTPEQQKKSLDAWIASIEKSIETQGQLDEEYKSVMDTTENRLKVAFNTLSKQIGDELGPEFARLVDDLIILMKALSGGDIIKTVIDLTIDAFEALIPVIFFMGAEIMEFVKIMANQLGVFLAAIGKEDEAKKMATIAHDAEAARRHFVKARTDVPAQIEKARHDAEVKEAQRKKEAAAIPQASATTAAADAAKAATSPQATAQQSNAHLIRLLAVHFDKVSKAADRQMQAADKIIAAPANNRTGMHPNK